MATKSIPVLVCDITGKEIKAGATHFQDVQIGEETYGDVSEDAMNKIMAYVARLGQPKKARKPKATI